MPSVARRRRWVRALACCVALPIAMAGPGAGQGTSKSAGQGAIQPVPPKIALARTAMVAGVAAAKAGNLAEAKRQFARAVELAPAISEGHAALGAVLLSLEESSDGAKELERALSLSPGDPSVELNLADADVALGRYAEAVKLFREAAAADSHPVFTGQDSIAFATALSATGEAAAAEETLREAVATVAKSGSVSGELDDALGTVVARRGAMEEAVELFRSAVAADASLAPAQYHLGVALLALNQPAEAIGPLQRAAANKPQDFGTQLQLGRAFSSLHRDVEALEALHRAVKLRTADVSPEATYALGLALQASGDPAAAIPLFMLAVNAGFASSEAQINLALALVQTGDAAKALPVYATALKVGPDSPTLREDYGVAYLQQADLDHAIEEFRAGLALDPKDAHLHYDLGLALKLKDNLAAAVPELERATELDETLPDSAYTLGVIYMQQGKFPEAARALKAATTLQPGNGDAWALLGSVLKDSGDASGAVDAIKRAIVLQPEQPGLHIQLAALESQAGDKLAAAADRRIAADLSRTVVSRQRAGFALKSARSLLAEGKLDEAIVQLKVAIQAEPTLAEPHRLLAEAYTRQGKQAEAALERKSAAALEPGAALD